MADWFVVVEAKGSDGHAEVFEFVDYRQAVAMARGLDADECHSVEVVDYEGRVVQSVGLDEFDGGQGWSVVPRRAGLYRWQEASQTFREVPR